MRTEADATRLHARRRDDAGSGSHARRLAALTDRRSPGVFASPTHSLSTPDPRRRQPDPVPVLPLRRADQPPRRHSPASVCMNCHGMLEKQTVEIEKLKEAVQQKRPIAWVKVHNLPDFVYFNHSQHVLSDVACQRCHGPVERMERVEQAAPLTMGWGLECHRERAKLPALGLARAARHLAQGSKPTAGLDCASCHY